MFLDGSSGQPWICLEVFIIYGRKTCFYCGVEGTLMKELD